METARSEGPLTANQILTLTAAPQPSPLTPDYVRLMEIYCVVKLGGVVAQKAVAQRLEQTEKASLQFDIRQLSVGEPVPTQRIKALQQEIQELEDAVANRLKFLSTITPAEETLIQQHLSDIEAAFTATAPGALSP